jgi:protein-disulfide isomerase
MKVGPTHRIARLAVVLALTLPASAVLGAGPIVASPRSTLPPRGATARKSVSRHVVATVERLLGGIPESGNELGYANAPVTMQIFGDLECPICRELALGALPGVIRHDVRTRKLRIEARALETATREPATFYSQQVAALAAGRQTKFWYFTEIFYREQGREDSGYVTNAYLRGIARQVPNLDFSAWSTARSDPLLTEQVVRDEHAAFMDGFIGTPSFLLGRTGGRLRPLEAPSLQASGSLEAAVAKVLRSSR